MLEVITIVLLISSYYLIGMVAKEARDPEPIKLANGKLWIR